MSGKRYLVERLHERSTWVWLAGALTAFGAISTPEDAEVIAGAGVALMSVLGVFLPDTFGAMPDDPAPPDDYQESE